MTLLCVILGPQTNYGAVGPITYPTAHQQVINVRPSPTVILVGGCPACRVSILLIDTLMFQNLLIFVL